jgi:N-acetyl-gamma-glutamylphosphate reductase
VLTKFEELPAETWKDIDAVFCCLPHATTQEIIASLPTNVKVPLVVSDLPAPRGW